MNRIELSTEQLEGLFKGYETVDTDKFELRITAGAGVGSDGKPTMDKVYLNAIEKIN